MTDSAIAAQDGAQVSAVSHLHFSIFNLVEVAYPYSTVNSSLARQKCYFARCLLPDLNSLYRFDYCCVGMNSLKRAFLTGSIIAMLSNRIDHSRCPFPGIASSTDILE